ncbi:MAG: 4-phosphoerythronate dehydrogenase [Muribaculaceae bacterium]
MKIIIENHIPFIQGIFEPIAHVQYLPAEAIDTDAMKDADALITRTRTRCDAALLAGSKCKFIATATIGTDHIDLDYCAKNGITVASAPGCNAPAVAQYVLTSISHIFPKLTGKTIGIVGVGHVGSIVARWAQCLGMNVLLCDPPRAEAERNDAFVSLSEIAQRADIITFHTPLTKSGPHKTFHLADEVFFNSLLRKPVIINSARGPVVDNKLLLNALNTGSISHAIVDCWEGEPTNISLELVDKAFIATPHIAGYSLEGKKRATQMAAQALFDYLGIHFTAQDNSIPNPPDYVTIHSLQSSYNPLADSAIFKAAPSNFEALRSNYSFRHEPKT